MKKKMVGKSAIVVVTMSALALAKEIIEIHGWNISVERRESGVAFLVRW